MNTLYIETRTTFTFLIQTNFHFAKGEGMPESIELTAWFKLKIFNFRRNVQIENSQQYLVNDSVETALKKCTFFNLKTRFRIGIVQQLLYKELNVNVKRYKEKATKKAN